MASQLLNHEVPDVPYLDGFDPCLPPLPEFPLHTRPGLKVALDTPLSSLSSATAEDTEIRIQSIPEDDDQVVPPKAKRSFKRSKTAEEKVARIKARNRRAQQAFRSRQKALNVERAESLENLQKEVTYLRQVNGQLLRKVEELDAELTTLRLQPPQQCMPSLGGLLKQEMSEASENLQSVCPFMGMIPSDTFNL